MALTRLREYPLVSVLVPNYNYGRYIGEALDSLLAQSYENWEAIVCDDGSTDESRRVIEAYAARDARIRYIFRQNGGVAAALNACYSAAQGEVISLLDADDLFLPHKIQRIVDGFTRNVNAGMCIHPILPYDGAKRVGDPFPIQIAQGWIAPVALRNGGYDPGLPHASGLSFRSVVLRAAFPLPVNLRRGLDFYLNGICIMRTEVVSFPEVLTLYRIHGSNISTGSELDSRDIEKNMQDQIVALNARCEHLRTLLGSWPAMQLQDNRAARNGALRYYLLEGKLSPSLPVPLAEMIRKEPDWRVRVVWRFLLLVPRRLGKRLLPAIRQWNAIRKRVCAVNERRSRVVCHRSGCVDEHAL